MEKTLFEIILEKHSTNKKICSLCKKLIKRCSFNSGADATNLCHLAYWLYVYGDDDSVLEVAIYTHNVAFPGRSGYNVWSFLLNIWGLESYILQKQNRIDEAKERIDAIDIIQRTPVGESTVEFVNRLTEKLRARTTYEKAIYREKLEIVKTKKEKDEYRLLALFTMIGRGATGFYPD